MGKIFTITEGLENMGALHTGGQGSVYKGKRIGEIYVAVKLLPTPIYAEDENDKHYKDFINEVEKLKKVNQVSNPNVVKILNSGITESGSLPFIEMEFIEGPDLAELLTEKDTPVFAIPEAIKVAYQLANALSHCHKVSVKHGDIKSNNVKFNINTGNYVLLDFGLAIMSDEQRRSSLRNAGAVEFMAPEQSEGNLLPQSDVYSYGIIMYELLAGTVPFKLNDNGQTARNAVMIAHLEKDPPDLLTLREKNMPLNWPEEQRRREMQVPEWLLALIYKCLQKDPAGRYTDGTELREAIQSSVIAVKNDTESALILQNEKEALELKLQEEQAKTDRLQKEIAQLKQTPTPNNSQPVIAPATSSSAKRSSMSLLIGIGFLFTCVGALAGQYLFNSGKADARAIPQDTIANSKTANDEASEPKPVTTEKNDTAETVKKPAAKAESLAVHKKAKKDSAKKAVKKDPPKSQNQVPVNTGKGSDAGKVFTLFTTYAYFYSRPDESTKRAANINQWNNARLKALDDQNGFIFVVYSNDKGQTSQGWLRKKDLIVVGQ
ncbi:serine/threonine protein kinase [Mucilaginibacter sp. ZT4R22]|uniref:Serine/threonine protein kinase n=1 Tax=Mucilaginibacter pankratovii TaxID=2772110 RepID=A0ABR7WUA6_9SPHI|nr:serine/threonine-protein kinase [Mucilaginibacter pankratovii]MBD1365885.1 serine/threonine protein kinase [Mucilaginibacter pankratovii]